MKIKVWKANTGNWEIDFKDLTGYYYVKLKGVDKWKTLQEIIKDNDFVASNMDVIRINPNDGLEREYSKLLNPLYQPA